jgi:hypothetical protein
MTVRPWAAFTTDLPDDEFTDEDGVFIFPGRNVAEAIRDVLTHLGAEVEEPEHEFEHGWTAHVKYRGHGFWYQVSRLGPEIYLVVEDNPPLLSPKQPKLYGELIANLNGGLVADSRFHDLLWYSREDGPCFPPDGTGSQDPFASGPRRPRPTNRPRQKVSRGGSRHWPRFLARLFGWLFLLFAASAISAPRTGAREGGVLFLVIAALLLSLGYRVRRVFGVRLPWVRNESKPRSDPGPS